MRIVFFSEFWTIVLCFFLWAFFQISAMIICFKLPDSYYTTENPVFRERNWESGGLFYEKAFRVRKWKEYLPDGGSIIKSGYSKRYLTDYTIENMEKFVTETCRAELTHILAFLPFWVFGLFSPPRVIIYMFIYALVANLPCIIVQRYNRIRFVRVLRKHSLK